MATALEQLRQGIGRAQQTSALDLLRQGIGKDEIGLIGTQTTTPTFIGQEDIRTIPTKTALGLLEGFAPRLFEAGKVAKEKGILEAAKQFFSPQEALEFREKRLAERAKEFEAQGKTPEEAQTLAKTEELAFMAIGATDAGAGKFALEKIPKELEPLAQEARKFKSAEEFISKIQSDIAELNQGLNLPSGFRKNAEAKFNKSLGGLASKSGVGINEKSLTDFYNQVVKGEKKIISTEFLPIEKSKQDLKIFSQDELKNNIQTIDEAIERQKLIYGKNWQARSKDLLDAREKFRSELVSRPLEIRIVGQKVMAEDILGEKVSINGAKEIKESVRKVEKIEEKVRLKEPKLTIKPIKTIADEAIKFAKENPDSSLVAKEFRNPKTKELESGPLLFRRIGESIRNGELNLEELPKIVTRYGISAENTAKLFEDASTFSGRTLQALSKVEKELRALLPDFVLPERIPTLWEKFKSRYLAVDNFRRGLLVTQLATAARNAISQTGRYALGSITDAMNGTISKITGKGEGFTPFFEDIAAVLRKFQKGNIEKLQKVLQKNPIENARLYNTPVGDVALTGKITNTLNAFNRGQEYFFRNLILDAKLNSAAKSKGISIEKLGVEDVKGAVDEALEWTYAKSPIRGSFGDAIMRTYRAMPPLTLINPFPRFMSNAVKFLFDYSPAGIMSLFNSKTRAAIAAGDYNTISKAIIGTSMLGGALTIRANDNLAGEKWYEIKVGDKRIDTRPFAPFSTYLFFAEVMFRGGERISGSDWAQAAIGINRVAGTGLALIDLVGQKVDTKNAKNIINGIISSYIGGFTVPFITLKDVIGNFKLEERTVKETKELPIIGGAIGNIPGLNELLPTKFSMFEDKPLQREQTLLRQLTGLTLKTKPFIEKELDRMGKDIGDLIPKTGNLKANRIISKQTGVILDQFNDKIEMSEKYKILGDDEKLEFLKNLISEAKKEARGEVASDLAGVVYNEIKSVKLEERKKTIQNLKNRGLLTDNIIDYLLPMLEAQPLSK